MRAGLPTVRAPIERARRRPRAAPMRAALVLGCALIAGTAGAELLPPGEAAYGYCTVCHGVEGAGNPAVGAPNIAVLDPWYLRRQLEAYRSGWRGTDANDLVGVEMRPVAARLDAAALDAIATYVATFEPGPVRSTVTGDLEQGANLYEACSACHGETGQGNQELGGPRLAGQSDWYLVHQLEGYRRGFRGFDAEDRWGLTMRPIVQALDDSDIRNVVAYINSLAEE